MKNNPVFQVLVVSDPNPLAVGSNLEALGVGQLGIFDADTNLSVDIANPLPNKFYFASGLPDATGLALGDIRKSAGEYIKRSLVELVTVQDCIAPVNQVISLDLSAFDPVYGEDYVMRFSFKSGRTMTVVGVNTPIKTFIVTTPNTNVGVFPVADFIALVIAEVNKDPEGVITAADAGGNVVTFVIGNEPKATSIGGINPRYDFLRLFVSDYGFGGAFEGGDYTVTSVGPTYEQGSGYDIQQLEYKAGGWVGNPGVYRDSETNGIFGVKEIQIFADKNKLYWMITIKNGRVYTSGGTLDYNSTLETVIAVPCEAEFEAFVQALIDFIELSWPGGQVIDSINVPTTTTTTTTSGLE